MRSAVRVLNVAQGYDARVFTARGREHVLGAQHAARRFQ
jgi:hypothetical protein